MSRRVLTRLHKQHNLLWNSKYYIQTKIKNDECNKELDIDLENTTEEAISAFKTLYMRYKDTLNPKPILNDKLSSKYLNSFTYSPMHLPPAFDAVSIISSYRAKIIDMNVIQWIEARYANHIINIEKKTKDAPQIMNQEQEDGHKSVLHIIELAVGFDTRFERIFLNQSNKNKRIEHEDYFLNEKEKQKIQEDDEETFEEMFNKMPSFAEMDNTISYNDYDVVYFYEIDLNNVIDLRQKLIKQNKIDTLIYEHNNNHGEHHKNKVYRKMYRYSVHDINWFSAIKNDIISNHKQQTGKEINNKNVFRNVCIVSEALFLFMKKHEMKELIENCCNTFNGAHFIFDESFTNEGLMNVEKEILKKNPMSYDVNNKVFLLKIDEINKRLAFWVRWSVCFLAKNHYRILCIQFRKPIENRMDQTQL